MRLDQLLVQYGHFASRARARDAIIRGCVLVEGKKIVRPGQNVSATAKIDVHDRAQNLVSRAGLKLEAALDCFAITAADKICLDIGISTGGFSQVLLARGAAHIIGIDVGHGQLHPSLTGEPRLTLHEGLNARHLERHHLGGLIPDLIVCDVSFISLKLALPPALSLAREGAQAVLLVKPQFEAGKTALNHKGLVKNAGLGVQIAQDMYQWLDGLTQWRSCALIAAPIPGGDGNQEFLLYGIRERDNITQHAYE